MQQICSEPPRVRRGIPFVGVLYPFFKDPLSFIENCRKRHGDVFTIPLLGKKFTYIHDIAPNDVPHIFSAPDEQLSVGIYSVLTKPIFGRNILFDAPAPHMRHQFRMIASRLTPEAVGTYVRPWQSVCQNQYDKWGSEGRLNLTEAFSDLAFFTGVQALYGSEFVDSHAEKVYDLYKKYLFENMSVLNFLMPKLPLPALRRRNRAKESLMTFLEDVLSQRKDAAADQDLLSVFANGKDEHGARMPRDERLGLMSLALFATHFNEAYYALWTTLFLLRNPTYLEQVKSEVRSVTSDTLSFEDVKNMKVLHACTREAMRLTSVMFLGRTVLEPFQYKGYDFSPGDNFFFSPYLLHRSSPVDLNPDQYCPERYAEPPPGESKCPMGKLKAPFFLNFGAGRHRCMGELFASTQIKVMVATLLRRFDMELLEHDPNMMMPMVFALPQKPVVVRYKGLNM
jgi:sterol 14-demethylase